ncbi:MAG: histidine kinase dimerization/phosphoacceptor domain -containing protein [Methanobacterium sp.]
MYKDINELTNAEKVQLENAMDLADLACWEFDTKTNQFIFNDRLYSMFGTTADNEGGYHMLPEDYIKKYTHPDDLQYCIEGFKNTLESGESAFGTRFQHRIIRGDGETRYIAIQIKIVKPTENKSAYVYGTVQDITDMKIAEKQLIKSIKEKEILIQEIHHRTKNNLLVIASLLNLQSSYIKDKASKDMFKESQNRARSMAIIHERLYQSTDLKRINFGEYINSLVTELFHTYNAEPSLTKLRIDADDILIDIDTSIPLGLIVNELITNCLLHAFPDGNIGEIKVDFHTIDDHYQLSVKDNGIGFPDDLDFKNTDSLGMLMINSLTDQIDGFIELDNSHGTEIKITFKELEYNTI